MSDGAKSCVQLAELNGAEHHDDAGHRRRGQDPESGLGERVRPGKPPDSSGKAALGNAPVSPLRVLVLVCGHSISAAVLLVVNKWALQVFPYIWLLTTLQFVPSAIFVAVLGMLGLAQVDQIDLRKLWAFLPAAGMFFVTMTAGNAVVKSSNVDTFIVMRSLVPIPCALLESVLLGEPCPRPLSWIGLGLVLFGALMYANLNRGLAAGSVSWIALFMVMMPVDAVVIKQLIGSVGLSQWGLVLYQNLVAGALGMACSIVLEVNSLSQKVDLVEGPSSNVVFPVVLSAVCGISLSYFQMSVRKVVSSTAFMVLGVANKLGSLLLNQLIMAPPGTALSSGCVVLSIFGAVLFQQTVKGKGISQAPTGKPSENAAASGSAFAAMSVGLAWSVYLFLME